MLRLVVASALVLLAAWPPTVAAEAVYCDDVAEPFPEGAVREGVHAACEPIAKAGPPLPFCVFPPDPDAPCPD